jgi:hypothetical protein
MKTHRLGIAGLLGIGLVLVLCSCGGSGSKRLTKEQFATKANALCTTFNEKVKASGTPKTMAAQIAQTKKLLPLDRKLVADVEKLKPPASEQATVNRVVTLGKEQADRIEALLAAIDKKDTAQIKKLVAEGDANDKETKALFRQLGVQQCAK